jgi:hypothetical protein
MAAQYVHKIGQMKLEQNLGLVSELLRLHSSSAKARLPDSLRAGSRREHPKAWRNLGMMRHLVNMLRNHGAGAKTLFRTSCLPAG